MKALTLTQTSDASIDGNIALDMPVRFSIEATESFIAWAERIKQLERKPSTIHLNFSITNFIDSSGIGALVRIIKIAQNHQIQITALHVNENILQIFKLTRLDEMIEINIVEHSQVNLSDMDNEIEPTHQSIRSYTKRSMDIIGSIVGLGITGLLFIPIALAIKLESPGSVFFSQTRVGLMGRKFKIYKFRTMVNDAEAKKNTIKNEAEGAIFKCKEDPRITRVGRFLRKTSLDELPQFLNVLTGSMSLIGTRPPTVDELEIYNIPHWQRLDVKPGISGEWQVNGRSEIKNFEDIVAMDLHYQKNWSLFYDIKLIFKTLQVVLSKNSGAM